MTRLDAAAESALDVARSEHQPNAADAARVRNALARRLLAEPLLIDTPSAGAHGAGSLNAAPLGARAIASKWLVALAIGGSAGFAVGFMSARAIGPAGTTTASSAAPRANSVAEPVTRETSPSTPPNIVAPAPALEPAPASAESILESPPRTPQSNGHARPSRAATETHGGQSPLQAELDGLRRAQELLHRGQAAWAIARLDELERAHFGSVLEEERLATRAIAECTLGRERAAQLEAFARRFPRSAHLEQVRASCSADTEPSSAEKRAPQQTESSVSPHQ